MDKTVITFGRLNPPTIGHEKLVDKVKQLAKRHNAEPHVFLSHSQNSKKDPLSYQQKFKYAKQAFGNVVYRSNSRTIIEIMKELERMNHSEVIMVVGSDRVQEFRALLKKYNGREYNFNKINVVSAGARDPDAEGVSGMSASKMRAAVAAGDQQTFMQGVPSRLSKQMAARLYTDLRSAMSIREEQEDFDWDLWAETVDIDDVELEELDEAVMTFQQRVKRARTMKRLAPRMKNLRRIKKFRMADKAVLMKRARKQAISLFRKKVAGDKGKQYASLSPAAKITIDKLVQKKLPAIGKLAQRLLPKVRKAEVERLRSARKPTNEQLQEGNKAQLGIPANATNAQLKKIRSSDSSSKQQKQRAHWLLNMRKEEDESLDEKCWPGYKEVGGKMKNGKMVPNCVPEDNSSVPQDKDIEDRKGTQPKKYFKDLPKSTKAARDAHFKKHAEKDDSDPANYKPAPGDKSAETKPSKHTKKFKKMYGESNGQTDDVQDIVPGRTRVSMISSSKKKLLNDKFEKLGEQDSAERTRDRQKGERERLKTQHKREKEQQKATHDRQMDRSQIRDIRSEELDNSFENFLDEQMKPRQQKGSSAIAPRSNYALEEKAIDALKKKSEKTGISYSILKKVYDRGMAAWKSGHRPGTTPQQWAFARVNSFATKSKGTWGGADKDLASRAKGKKESVRVGPYMGKAGVTESLDESFETGLGQMITAKEAGIEIQAGFALHPSVAEEGGAGEYGTNKLTKKYKKETPCQEEQEEDENNDEV